MLSYSLHATLAQAKMLERFNSITVFIEDRTKQNYYREFIGRLLGPEHSIRTVIPCDGRAGVIQAARADQNRYLKSKVFLIDGDLHMLCGEPEGVPGNVFILDVYCIENYFLCLGTAHELAAECECDLSKSKVMKQLGLESWLRQTTSRLIPLFIWYAVAMAFSSQIKTSSISGLAFLERGDDIVSASLVKAKISTIRARLEDQYGKSLVKKVYSRIRKQALSHEDKAALISGKSYLIPLLARRLHNKSSFRDGHGLTMRLARRCETARAERLRDELFRSLRKRKV